jgi:hypothetical protein
MGQHAVTMQSLIRAVVLLDRRRSAVMANRIADEEVVARTSGTRDKKAARAPAEILRGAGATAATHASWPARGSMAATTSLGDRFSRFPDLRRCHAPTSTIVQIRGLGRQGERRRGTNSRH